MKGLSHNSQVSRPIRRGGILTSAAIFFALAAGVDVLKALTTPPPPEQQLFGPSTPTSGIVLLGVRHSGPERSILGLLFAAFLLSYALGIWRMKRYAMVLAWIYAAYMLLNVSLFAIRNPIPP